MVNILTQELKSEASRTIFFPQTWMFALHMFIYCFVCPMGLNIVNFFFLKWIQPFISSKCFIFIRDAVDLETIQIPHMRQEYTLDGALDSCIKIYSN